MQFLIFHSKVMHHLSSIALNITLCHGKDYTCGGDTMPTKGKFLEANTEDKDYTLWWGHHAH